MVTLVGQLGALAGVGGAQAATGRSALQPQRSAVAMPVSPFIRTAVVPGGVLSASQ